MNMNLIKLKTERLNYVDAILFDSLIKETRIHNHKNIDSRETCTETLKSAIALYKGNFFENYHCKTYLEFCDPIIEDGSGKRRYATLRHVDLSKAGAPQRSA